jgi:ribA/ribD-fused uncharacterized protein
LHHPELLSQHRFVTTVVDKAPIDNQTFSGEGIHMTLPLSIDDLHQRVRAGEAYKYVHFWGHRVPKDGRITSSCFSQWYGAAFVVDGVRCPTAEHYMMAAKARLLNDNDSLARVLAASSPAAAKAIGRGVRGFNEDEWKRHRFEIVCQASVAKFDQDRELREYLLSTKNRVLVEASPTDRAWGIGMAASDSAAQNPLLWRGLNLLGFALMSARETLGTSVD